MRLQTLGKILAPGIIGLGLLTVSGKGEVQTSEHTHASRLEERVIKDDTQRVIPQNQDTGPVTRNEVENKILEHFIKYEGLKPLVYDPNPKDGKPEPTIGIGHYMGKPDSREIFQRVLPGVDYDSVLKGELGLTEEQAITLFNEDLRIKENLVRSLLGNFDEYSDELKLAVLDGFFRGCLSGSPKTLRLLNEYEFDKAADEYLNNREYKGARQKGMAGIAVRMEGNAEVMRNEALRYKTN